MMQTGITAAIEKPVVLTELRSLITNVIAEKNKLLNKVEEAIANYHINAMDHVGFEDKEGERFFTLFNEVLEENFQDYDFRLVEAAKLMHMGDKTLSRKIAKYYQLKFGDLVKKYRLNKARELIIKGQRVTTVAYETGFNSASYFTQCFRAEFGFAPSMLAKER
jgi:AraC-like DNA-binding protein